MLPTIWDWDGIFMQNTRDLLGFCKFQRHSQGVAWEMDWSALEAFVAPNSNKPTAKLILNRLWHGWKNGINSNLPTFLQEEGVWRAGMEHSMVWQHLQKDCVQWCWRLKIREQTVSVRIWSPTPTHFPSPRLSPWRFNGLGLHFRAPWGHWQPLHCLPAACGFSTGNMAGA